MVDRAKVLRGKRKGEIVELHQYCNNWATLNDGSVVRLSSLELDEPTWVHFLGQLTKDQEEKTTKRMGQMFRMYYDYEYFYYNRRFKRMNTKKPRQ